MPYDSNWLKVVDQIFKLALLNFNVLFFELVGIYNVAMLNKKKHCNVLYKVGMW
jgi:hypothetical protein